MLLGDYFRLKCGGGNIKCGLSICYIERINFKIPDTKAKWYTRIKDIEVSDSLIVKTCNQILEKGTLRPKTLKRIEKIRDSLGTPDEPFSPSIGTTYLYIMRNEIGMFKVGISKTPQDRARNISTGCGLNVELLAYYGGKFPARDIEQKILHTFKEHLKLGEWFKPNTITFEDIEGKVPDSYSRIWCCKEMTLLTRE